MTQLLRPVVLLGLPGAGKSTVGAALNKAGVHAIDLDRQIERSAGSDVSSLIERYGEGDFRARETEALSAALKHRPPAVVIGGGGLLLTPRNRELIAPFRCLMLHVRPEVAQTRLRAPGRPLLPQGEAATRAFFSARQTALAAVSALSIDANRPASDVVDDVLRALASAAADCRLPRALLGERPEDFSAWLSKNASRLHGVAIDPAVAELANGVLPTNVDRIVIEEKSLAAARRLWARWAPMPRDGVVLAIGGGRTCDLVGFCAATLARGRSWAAVPTTALCAIDAAIGGKTGIDDADLGKNAIGSLHPAEAVLQWDAPLSQLPQRERASAAAEMIKMLILDGAMESGFDDAAASIARWVKDGGPDIPFRSQIVGLKSAVVDEDPTDIGIRQALNLGHTAGHAMEQAAQGALRHGEAVGLGLRVAISLAQERGHVDDDLAFRWKGALVALAPPAPQLKLEQVLALLALDKKSTHGALRWVLPRGHGRIGIFGDVDDGHVAAALSDVL